MHMGADPEAGQPPGEAAQMRTRCPRYSAGTAGEALQSTRGDSHEESMAHGAWGRGMQADDMQITPT